MNLFKRLLLINISLSMIISLMGISPIYADTVSSEQEVSAKASGDTQEVKYLVDENFLFVYKEGNISTNKLRPSGWDIRDAGGSFAQSYHQGNFKIIDNSSELPVEMNRKFESVTFGDLVLEYRIKFVAYADGISWSMSKGYNDGMKIITDNGGLYLQQPEGGAVFLSECETDKDYGIKAIIHMESKTVSVYINGKLAAEGKAMLSPVESIDNFDLNTGDLAKCEMYFPEVKIYRGYKVNERFISSTAAIPDDWEVISNGGSALVYQTGSRSQPDIYSLKLDGTNGEAALQKIIDPQNRSMVFECKFLIPEKSDGVNILLQNSKGGLLSVSTSNGSLCYNVSGTDIPFYDYLENLWYHLKIEFDLPSSTARLYLNGKLKQENIALSAFSEINTITLKADGASALFDDILLYPKADEPDDYVPAPQKAQSTDYAVGMQTCPLWKEGNHLGWDWINSDPKRKPYLGFYDENSPELADWEIKYMVEHGINYMMQCWYQPVAPKDEPIKDSYGGWSINDAYFYAKYSNMLDFMILWENSAAGSSNAPYDFENNIIPYWIEYYLKDSRYFKLNNRPVIGIYNYNVFVTAFGGEEGAKAALALLRQKCIEANVGNPILITTAGSGGNIGFDYRYTYNFGSGDVKRQETSMLNWKKEVDANLNINIIPCMTMGYDVSAWGGGAGSYAKPEDFKNLGKWIKEDYVPALKNSGLEKQMVMCNSWNEYGEGHFIMPSELYGFGYLDAIRDVFVGGNTDHTDIDVTPTDNQKNRFNNLYPADRKVNSISKGEKPDIPTEVKAGWYFDANKEGWGAGGDIGNLTAYNGAIEGEITGKDPQMKSSDNLGVDISDVTYIKIKMKNASPNGDAELFFTTDKDAAWGENKTVKFKMNINDTEFTDYYLETWNCSTWKGTLKQLRIDPAVAIKQEGKFYIDSIELLGEPHKEITGTRLNVNSNISALNTKPITIENRTMLPLKVVLNAIEAKIDWDGRNNTVNILRNGKLIRLPIGDAKAYKDGKQIVLDRSAVVIEDKTYVPLSFVTDVLDVKADWDVDKDTLFISTTGSINYGNKKIELPKREKLYAAEFDSDGDLEGWAFNGQCASINVSNGFLSLKTTGTDPIMTSPDEINLDASAVKNICIGMQNATPSSEGRIYFKTDKDGTVNESKAFGIKLTPNDSKVTEYNIDTSKVESWKNKILKIRFDPTTDIGNIKIDYIRFEGEPVVSKPSDILDMDMDDNSPHTTVFDNIVSWEFDTNGFPEGWTLNKEIGNVSVKDGNLFSTIVGPEPEMFSNGNLAINTADISSIYIKYANQTGSDKAELYFITDANPNWSDEQCFTFDTVKDDSAGERYEITPQSNPLWKGKLIGFKFKPTTGKGNIIIDYIRLKMSDTWEGKNK